LTGSASVADIAETKRSDVVDTGEDGFTGFVQTGKEFLSVAVDAGETLVNCKASLTGVVDTG
jgi:hypothetical protein